MRTYLIYKEKARQFNEDTEVQDILSEIRSGDDAVSGYLQGYSSACAKKLKAHHFDREEIGSRNMQYERLDQLTIDILTGVR